MCVGVCLRILLFEGCLCGVLFDYYYIWVDCFDCVILVDQWGVWFGVYCDVGCVCVYWWCWWVGVCVFWVVVC